MPSKKKRHYRPLTPKERFAETLAIGPPIQRTLMDPTPKYTGVLAKPFPKIRALQPPFDGRLPSFNDFENVELHMANEVTRRLFLLLDHYGIDPRNSKSRWFFLAHALARIHVRAFRFEKDEKRGLKLEWKYRRELVLYAAVKLRVLDGLTVAEACRQLAKMTEYRPMKASSLRTTFQRIKRENPSAIFWERCPPEEYPQFKEFLSAVMK